MPDEQKKNTMTQKFESAVGKTGNQTPNEDKSSSVAQRMEALAGTAESQGTGKSTTIAQPPQGYGLFNTRRWGEEPMATQGAYTTEKRHNVGSFEVISCYISETQDFSSISNFCKLNHDDMVKLANTQLLHFGHPFNMKLEEMRKMEGKKLDGFNLKQKMSWLYQPLKKEGETPGLEMWGMGEWFETEEARYGTMVHGGQMVACATETVEITCKLAGEKAERPVTMRKLLPFRRSDWGKTHAEYPWLIHKCTVANHPGSKFNEATPKGLIYAPVALDWRDFPFKGQIVPSAYYLVDDWLIHA